LKTHLPIFLATAILALVGCKASRQGYESAPYRVLSSDDGLEIRDYPAITVAETRMRDDSGATFNRLFRYISGNNEDDAKIAMTTPVFMGGTPDDRSMAFVMPGTLQQPPKPGDPEIRITTIPPSRYAVLRFPGSRNPKAERSALRELESRMAAKGMAPTAAEPIYAYFDPPWIPSFLRRNEVMLPIKNTPPGE
jgi:DNA gyrase inhibitor GyrI